MKVKVYGVILVLLLGWMICMCCGSVAENSEDTILTLNQMQTIVLNQYESMWFSFTPEEDGIYTFSSHTDPNYWAYTTGTIYDSQNHYLTLASYGAGFTIEWPLKANQTYRLEVTLDDDYNQEIGVSVKRSSCIEFVPNGAKASGSCDENGYMWYSFIADQAGAYEICLENVSTGSGAAILMDAESNPIQKNPVSDGENMLRFTEYLDARRYYLRVYQYSSSGAAFVSARSFEGVITAGCKDGIQSYPVNEGDSQRLEAVIQSTNNLYTCQWYKVLSDGTMEPVEGATQTTYTTEPISYRSDYICRVTDLTTDENRQTDVSFRVYIKTGLVVQDKNTHPNYYVTVQDNDLTFEVEAYCNYLPETELTYQWYLHNSGTKQNTPIEGAVFPTFKPGYIKNNYPIYLCTVTDSYGNHSTESFSVYTHFYTGLSVSAVSATSFGGYNGTNYTDTSDITLEVTARCTQKDRDGNEIIPDCQWYRYTMGEYVPISGATGTSYSPGILTRSETFKFVASDGFGGHNEVWFYINVNISNELNAWVKEDEAHGQTSEIMIPKGECQVLNVEYSYRYVEPECQWYIKSSGTDAEPEWVEIEGANHDSYTTDPINQATDYACRIKDLTSDAAPWITFHIGVENHLTAQATSGNAKAAGLGEDAELAVEANCDSGSESLRYAWLEYVWSEEANCWLEQLIQDAEEPVFTVENVRGYRMFRCNITDAYGNRKAVDFTVTVQNHLTASAAPNDHILVQPYDDGIMTVEASCDDHSETYEWHHYSHSFGWDYDDIIENETGPSCNVGEITRDEQYYCLVRDGYGTTVRVEFMLSLGNGLIASANQDVYWVFRGRTVTLQVTAESKYHSRIEYNWYHDLEDGTRVYDGSSYTQKVTNVQESMTYYCSVQDARGSSVLIPIRIEVSDSAIMVTERSNEIVLCEAGSGAVLSCTASSLINSGLRYQWSVLTEENGEITYTNVGEQTTGNSAQMEVNPVSDLSRWRCEITDQYSHTIQLYWTVDVIRPINAYAVMDTVWVEEGQDADLAVIATSSEGLTLNYRWYLVSDGGETELQDDGPSMTVAAVQEEGRYVCSVSDGGGNEQRVNFSVKMIPAITASSNLPNGLGTATRSNGWGILMNVTASSLYGETLNYQWYEGENLSLIEGETDSYYYTGVLYEETRFVCRVSDTSGHHLDVPFLITTDNDLRVIYSTGGPIYLEPNKVSVISVSAECHQGSVYYQWYSGINQSLSILPEEWTVMSGKTGRYLTVYGGNNVQEVQWYRCEIRDEERFGNVLYVDIPVLVPNVIATAAEGGNSLMVEIEPDQEKMLQVSAYCRNGATPIYNWYQSTYVEGKGLVNNLLNETTPSLTVSAEKADYYCLVSDGNGQEARVDYHVVVNSGLTACAKDNQATFMITPGESVTLQVQASNVLNSDLSYFWMKSISWENNAIGYTYVEGAELQELQTGPITTNTKYQCCVSDGNLVRYVDFNVITDASVFTWSDPTYEWDGDNSHVQASRTCLTDESITETETVETEAVTTATCTEEGMTTFTASFAGSAFEMQTKTIETEPLGHDWGAPEYWMGEDGKTIHASHSCLRIPSHVETGTALIAGREIIKAPTESEPGEMVYRSEAFEDPAFGIAEIIAADIPTLSDMDVLRLPIQVKTIEEEAFAGLPMDAVIIPEGCETIESLAFANCGNLEFIYIDGPIGEESIANNAFSGSDVIIVCQVESGAARYAESNKIQHLTNK